MYDGLALCCLAHESGKSMIFKLGLWLGISECRSCKGSVMPQPQQSTLPQLPSYKPLPKWTAIMACRKHVSGLWIACTCFHSLHMACTCYGQTWDLSLTVCMASTCHADIACTCYVDLYSRWSAHMLNFEIIPLHDVQIRWPTHTKAVLLCGDRHNHGSHAGTLLNSISTAEANLHKKKQPTC